VAATRLPSTQASVARAIAFAWLFAERARLADNAAERLAIVVEEWLMNIVEHGAAPPASEIALKLERLGDRVRLTVSDAGVAFDPRLIEFSGPNEDRGGGAGLALISAWARFDSYQHRGGRNQVVMELPAE
jgi:serine/threonine-protein kinase RsbW